MIKAPCKNCPNRYLGCHDRCDKYSTYKKSNNKLKHIIREDRWLHSITYGSDNRL